jgi:hypothetical protein
MLATLEADFDRAREAAGRAGRSAEALQVAVNRVAVVSRPDMPAAADTLMRLKKHLKRFGQYLVDMNVPPMPFDIKPLFTTRA